MFELITSNEVVSIVRRHPAVVFVYVQEFTEGYSLVEYRDSQSRPREAIGPSLRLTGLTCEDACDKAIELVGAIPGAAIFLNDKLYWEESTKGPVTVDDRQMLTRSYDARVNETGDSGSLALDEKEDGRAADPVNPPHYLAHAVTPIDLIRSYELNFSLGNVIKYVARHREKNGREDLKKALWYLLEELGVNKDRIQGITNELN